MRKNYPAQRFRVADWRQVNGVNRGVVKIGKRCECLALYAKMRVSVGNTSVTVLLLLF